LPKAKKMVIARINPVMFTSGLPAAIIASVTPFGSTTLALRSSGASLELLPGGTALPHLGFAADFYTIYNSSENLEDLWVHCN
jgi:hypothetical protein